MIVQRWRATLAAAGVLLSGCEPEPKQWLVSVATDAPVPRFGDHLLLEVVDADASCAGCLRMIGVDDPSSLPVSFGVVPKKEGDLVRIRARLFRAEQAGDNGLPDSAALIDAVAQLPPLEGETRVAFNLSMGCFGIARTLDDGTTCDPALGTLAPEPVLPLLADAEPQPAAGSWPELVPVACKGATPPGMVCVPGGVFILGTPRPAYVVDFLQQSQPEHLVKVSPFALDLDEVTVGAVRELVKSGKITTKPISKDKSAPETLAGACTYLGVADASGDAFPMNCISLELAAEVCAALGKRLPSEAEWEYAAGNLDAETPYPWGTGGDLCKKALLGVGRTPDESGPDVYESSNCRSLEGGQTWGPVAGGQPNDVTLLGIRNLAGSTSEWVADVFAPYTAPCWQPTGALLESTPCQAPVAGMAKSFSTRGASWSGYKIAAAATARGSSPSSSGNPAIGFRCAMSM